MPIIGADTLPEEVLKITKIGEASPNVGAGVDESMTFTTPTSGDCLLVITNEDGGSGVYTISFFDEYPIINF